MTGTVKTVTGFATAHPVYFIAALITTITLYFLLKWEVETFDNFLRPPVLYTNRLFWTRFGRLMTSVKTEEDVYIGNVVFASMFQTDIFYANECNGNYEDNLPKMLKQNYTANIHNRVNFLSIKEMIDFPKSTLKSKIHPKLLTKQNADYRMFFNFYMDGSFIGAAVKDYPSTWVPSTGKMLEDYDANRAAFLEKLAQKSQTK